MLLSLLALTSAAQERVLRTPAIFRCPQAEAESDRFPTLIEDSYFDRYCIEPRPGPEAVKALGKLKVVSAATIDTPANLKWRNATIAYVRGEISPQAWLKKTSNLGETVHFLSNPKTKPLREALADVKIAPGGTYSGRAVFAQFVLLTMPGVPCLNSHEIGRTRPLPEPGKHQSWILAMNDWFGPLLYSRAENAAWATKKRLIDRADSKPGLLVFRVVDGKRSWRVTLNNGFESLKVPHLSVDHMTLNRGVDFDSEPPKLVPTGCVIEDLSEDALASVSAPDRLR